VGKKATNIASRELGKYRGTLVKLEQNLPIFNQVDIDEVVLVLFKE
jgi:hypothetical protein